MAVGKGKNGTYTVQCWYRDQLTGERRKKTKRGFRKKADAVQWERDFLTKAAGSPTMRFSDCCEIHKADLFPRLKYNTWRTKSYQRIDRRDVITATKTAKSVRTVAMPDFVTEEVEEYIRLEGYEEGPDIPLRQVVPLPRDGKGLPGVGREANTRARPAPLPREPAHRDGVQHRGDRRPRGAREHRHHVPVRAPVPQHAGRHGAQAQPGEEFAR